MGPQLLLEGGQTQIAPLVETVMMCFNMCKM